MALPTNWFTGTGSPNYTDLRCDYDFSGASLSTTTLNGYIRSTWGPCAWLVWLPNKQIPGGFNNMDPNHGFIYLREDATSDLKGILYAQHPLRSAPATSATSGESMQRPFSYGASTGTSAIVLTHPTGGTQTCSVYIWQPWAWYGRCAQVIAAILMHQDLGTGYIDMPTFSDADDGQDNMGSTAGDEPWCFYRRQIGQSLADAITQLALCSWDLLTITMAGKVAMFRRVGIDAGYVIDSLDADDGLIVAQWRYAPEHLANMAYTCHGRYYDLATEDLPSSFDARVSSCNEVAFPTVVTNRSGFPFASYSNSASVIKHGMVPVGRTTRLMQDDVAVTVDVVHFQYMCNIETSPSNPVDTLMDRLDVDAQLRREIRVVQDMLGVDYDCGWEVRDVAVTHDGETIDVTRCIGKIVNFRDMTVTSTLLEEPEA